MQHIISRLAHDEVHDVGMVNPEDAHVGPATGSALLDGFCGRVKYTHKGNRAAGNAGGGHDQIIGRTQPRERKSGAAAGLMNQSRVFEGVENFLHGVSHRQNEASR